MSNPRRRTNRFKNPAADRQISKIDTTQITQDYLDEDPPISGQKWFCASFATISDETKSKIISDLADTNHLSSKKVETIINGWTEKENPKRGFKIRGCDETSEESKQRCQRLRDFDKYFHVFSGEVGKWITFGQNPTSVDEQHFYENELNELVKGHKEHAIMSKQHYETRKAELMEKAIKDGTRAGQEEAKKSEDAIQAVEARIDTTKDQISAYREKLEELEEQLEKDTTLFNSLLKENPDYKPGQLTQNPTKPIEHGDIKTAKAYSLESNDEKVENIKNDEENLVV